jgi:hypothetical protein
VGHRPIGQSALRFLRRVRDIGIDRRDDLAVTQRHARCGEILTEAAARLARFAEKTVEMAHGAGRQVVQNRQRPRLCRDLCMRTGGPAIGVRGPRR